MTRNKFSTSIPGAMRLATSFTLGLLLCSPPVMAHSIGVNCENPQRLRFSMIPEGALERDLEAYKPLLQDMEVALGIPVEVVKLTSYNAVVEGMLSGAIDVARLGPATYVRARSTSNAIQPFASYSSAAGAWQQEGKTYRSLLIVRAQGKRNSLASLRGGSLALADPSSTSASVVPRALFPKKTNMPLAQFFGWTGYAGTHDAAVRSVLEGRADAAFVASIQLSALQRRMQFDPRELKVLWQSPPLPLDPFVYRSKLCAPLRARVEESFLRFHARHPASTLSQLEMTHFIKSSDSDFDVIRALDAAAP